MQNARASGKIVSNGHHTVYSESGCSDCGASVFCPVRGIGWKRGLTAGCPFFCPVWGMERKRMLTAGCPFFCPVEGGRAVRLRYRVVPLLSYHNRLRKAIEKRACTEQTLLFGVVMKKFCNYLRFLITTVPRSDAAAMRTSASPVAGALTAVPAAEVVGFSA